MFWLSNNVLEDKEKKKYKYIKKISKGFMILLLSCTKVNAIKLS